MAVPRDDLSRRRFALQSQPLAHEPLHLGVAAGVDADGARQLSDSHPFDGAGEPLTVAIELEGPTGELCAERDRLGVDAVRPPGHRRRTMFLGPSDDGAQGCVDSREQQRSRLAQLKRERRVQNVRGGQAVVQPAGRRPGLLRDRVDEGGDVVMRACLDLGHLAPVSEERLAPASSSAASSGTTPISAQASVAASSTSSQRASFDSSDQIAFMAGRE